MLRLVARYGDQVFSLALEGEQARIGSDPGNDLVVTAPGVSRHHALALTAEGGVQLQDRGSKNKLILGGQRLQDLLLVPGQSVQLGHATLTLEEVRRSDAELALEIPVATPPPRFVVADTEPLPADLQGRDWQDLASPDAALSFLARGSSDGRALIPWDSNYHFQAREILGARCLMLFELRRHGAPGLLEMSGPSPPRLLLRELEARLIDAAGEPAGSSRLLLWTMESQAVGALVARPEEGPGRWLVALLPVGISPAPWQQDFLLCVGQHNGVGQAASEEDGPASLARAALRPPEGMVLGDSPAIVELLDELQPALRGALDVLLLGETGTGKEFFARLIHRSSATQEGPFVAINCAAIPAELLEAELFGVESRVATGVDPRPGHFVRAEGGTLLLDEIGEMPLALQAKLLRVIQEREVLPLGGRKPQPVRVRLISTTNRHLEERVQKGRFRADLFYRLCGLCLTLPPLRDRREDIPQLALHFARNAADEYGKRIRGLSRGALHLLLDSDWPGNVRQLKTEVERAVLLCESGGTLETVHFSLRWNKATQDLAADRASPVAASAFELPPLPAESALGNSDPESNLSTSGIGQGAILPLREQLDAVERAALKEALAASGGNKTKAASLLGITRQGLNLKLSRLDLDSDPNRPDTTNSR